MTDDYAFPQNHHDFGRGLTLRDYLAAAALPGLITAAGRNEGLTEGDAESAAYEAYLVADAMLEARVE